MSKTYIGEVNDKIFDEYDVLKKRLITAINKTVDFYNTNARFTLRVKTEKMDNIVFEPATLKLRRVSGGTSVTISGDVLHIAVADFPDVTDKVQKLNKKLIELGMSPVEVPDKENPGDYLRRILEIYKKIEGTGISIKLP